MIDFETLSPDAPAIIMLCTSLGEARDGAGERPLGPVAFSRLAEALARASFQGPRDLIGLAPDEMARSLGVEEDVAAGYVRRLARGGQLAFELDRLRSRGVWVVTIADAAYPTRLRDRLGSSAPPVLFGSGPAALLDDGGVAIVGSRDVDDAAVDFAARLAASAARGGTLGSCLEARVGSTPSPCEPRSMPAGWSSGSCPKAWSVASERHRSGPRSPVARRCSSPRTTRMQGSARAPPWAATSSSTRWPMSPSSSRPPRDPAGHGPARSRRSRPGGSRFSPSHTTASYLNRLTPYTYSYEINLLHSHPIELALLPTLLVDLSKFILHLYLPFSRRSNNSSASDLDILLINDLYNARCRVHPFALAVASARDD